MSDESNIEAGLDAFAAGEIEVALRAWALVDSSTPAFEYAASYLAYARSEFPTAYSECFENDPIAEHVTAHRGVSTTLPEMPTAIMSAAASAPVPRAASEAARESPSVEDRANDEPSESEDPWGEPDAVAAGGDGFAMLSGVQQQDDSEGVRREEESGGEADILDALGVSLRDAIDLDDFAGAVEVADQILERDPEHEFALATRERYQDRLLKMHYSKLGDQRTVPIVLCPPDQIIWLDLDHRSGFILSQVDGVSSYQEIVEIAGMDPNESVAILARLVTSGVIGPRS